VEPSEITGSDGLGGLIGGVPGVPGLLAIGADPAFAFYVPNEVIHFIITIGHNYDHAIYDISYD
jgi:hypothetical protein